MMPIKLTGSLAVILLALAVLTSAAPSKEPNSGDQGGDAESASILSASENSDSVTADGVQAVGQNEAAEEPVDLPVLSEKQSASGGNCAARNIDAMTLSVPIDAGTIVNLLANTGCKLMCKGGNSGKTGKGGNSDDDAVVVINTEGNAADATGSTGSDSSSVDGPSSESSYSSDEKPLSKASGDSKK